MRVSPIRPTMLRWIDTRTDHARTIPGLCQPSLIAEQPRLLTVARLARCHGVTASVLLGSIVPAHHITVTLITRPITIWSQRSVSEAISPTCTISPHHTMKLPGSDMRGGWAGARPRKDSGERAASQSHRSPAPTAYGYQARPRSRLHGVRRQGLKIERMAAVPSMAKDTTGGYSN